ncbi:hypothetical protein M378DRAFT_202460 [Amanita muscaria Koide BX008]|uniref:Uncharacterized protein n=1 Tax=Amanita muscaria (strain Koide BX008) TaxID=946122 RepID=A0A0C2XPL8_AMAMK|nr:hypothetical protein M378DRAFT_202460 [Amanita muscaria Koide BX008]
MFSRNDISCALGRGEKTRSSPGFSLETADADNENKAYLTLIPGAFHGHLDPQSDCSACLQALESSRTFLGPTDTIPIRLVTQIWLSLMQARARGWRSRQVCLILHLMSMIKMLLLIRPDTYEVIACGGVEM